MPIHFSVLQKALKGKHVVVVGNSTKVVENQEDHTEVCNNADFVVRMQEGVANTRMIPYTGKRCDIYISRKATYSLQDSCFDTPKFVVWATPNEPAAPECCVFLPEDHVDQLRVQIGSWPTMGARAVYMALQCGAKVSTVGMGFYSPECNEVSAAQHNGENEKRWCLKNGVTIL